MVIHRKHTEMKNKKSWAHFCPQTKKSTRQKRHLASKTLTKIETRHLAVNNKRLSASTGKRAEVLRVLYENKLRKRQTKALSKKVNKDVSGIENPQSETTTPRAKNTKVPRTHNNRNIQRKTRNWIFFRCRGFGADGKSQANCPLPSAPGS